ncbi:hypothetical protein [Salinicoccus sp. YB14-2]|uniref:hypothetical protein n=1 Tax=Salinicoccus sp. YB14-2 TaxID=1572701 RepID=UPI00068AF7CA|nr:hypothetical protein [Salinicoccus sp. YB14-2]
MKKLIFLMAALSFILMGCGENESDDLESLYEAFNRNHEELRNEMERELEDIRNSDERENQLDIYYNNLIPKFEDFKSVINNYDFGESDHLELQESMLDYINTLETLTKRYGEFNLNFYVSNPMDDDSFSETFDEDLEEIKKLEDNIDSKHDLIEEQYESINEE